MEIQLAAIIILLGGTRDAQDPQPMHNLRPNLVFDSGRSEIQIVEQDPPYVVHLTAQERAMLLHLVSAPRRWFSTTELSSHLISLGLLSAEAQAPDRSVMGLISQLRSKLCDYDHTLIRLNRRIGYGIFPIITTP
jgi:DNA-binding response OmpR family regulator